MAFKVNFENLFGNSLYCTIVNRGSFEFEDLFSYSNSMEHHYEDILGESPSLSGHTGNKTDIDWFIALKNRLFLTCIWYFSSDCSSHRLVQWKPVRRRGVGEPVFPAIPAVFPRRWQHQGSTEDPPPQLLWWYFLFCFFKQSTSFSTVSRLPDLVSLGRTQQGASSCWTCGGTTSLPMVSHPHRSWVLPQTPVDLNTPPGCPEIPTFTPAEEYEEYRRCVINKALFCFIASLTVQCVVFGEFDKKRLGQVVLYSTAALMPVNYWGLFTQAWHFIQFLLCQFISVWEGSL